MKLNRRTIPLLTLAAAALLVLGGALLGRCTDHSSSTPRGLSGPFVSGVGFVRRVDVAAYGAKGDGSTDDRTAITNAMSAACAVGASELFFPPGTYNVSRNGLSAFALDVSCDGLILSGVRGKSIIRHPTGMPNAQVDVIRVNAHKNVTIRDLVIDGNWGNCVTRISLSSNNVALNGASTINVEDASCFPAGTFGAAINDSAGTEYLTCTGHTSTTLTGCTAGAFAGGNAIGTMYVESRVGYVDANAGINHTTQIATGHGTTIASGSNGAVLPQSTIFVADASGFAYVSGDDLIVKTSFGYQHVTCTGSTGTTFTGCTGGTGTLATGNEIYNAADPKNMGIRVRGAENVLIENVDIRNVYGDCIWLGGGVNLGIGGPDRNIRINDVNCKVAARDGIAFGGAVDGVHINNFFSQDIKAQAIDGEPVTTYVRDADIGHSVLDGWFVRSLGAGNAPLSIVGGGSGGAAWTGGSSARSWHIHDNLILGAVLIERADATVFEGNSVRAPNISGTSPIMIEFASQNLAVLNNYVYSMGTSSGLEGGGDLAAIQVWAYQAGSTTSAVASVEIAGNFVRAVNGRHGISIKGGGNRKSGTSGTATGSTSTTLVHAGAGWSTNQWSGHYVRMGAAVGYVVSNTSDTITLDESIGATAQGWTDGLGNQAATPTAGAYVILQPTGILSVHDNHLDMTNDGRGAGKYGINITPGSNNDTSLRVQLRRNHIKNCDTYAIRVKFDASTNYPLVEISDNDAHDDQPTATCTSLVRFDGTIHADQLIMGGNVVGEGVTNPTSNITAGTWMVRGGVTQEWAGFGSPVSVVTAPIGSTYYQVDGGSDTAFWVKVGSGSTAWNKRGQIENLITGESGDGRRTAKGIAPTLTSCGSSPSAVTGDDAAGHFTEGTGASGCTLTFHTACGVAPSCNVGSRSNLGFTYTTSTTALTITNVGALSGTVLDYHCDCH